MTILVPIVGLSHYVADVSATLKSMTPGRKVMLVPDNGNLIDNTAIQAWVNGSLVGYVSADFTELIRINYSELGSITVEVAENKYAQTDKAFYVAIDLETLFYEPASRIALAPFHDIPLPTVNMSKIVALLEMENRMEALYPTFDGVHFSDAEAAELLDITFCFSRLYGHSLSGSEQRVFVYLNAMLESALTYYTSNMSDLYSQLLDLQEIRCGFANNAEKAAKLMQDEIQALQPQLTAFLSEVDALITSDMVTRKQLLNDVELWLRSLPNHLYAHISMPQNLALRLLYLHLSSEELYTIYIYLLLRSHLKRTRKAKTKEKPTLNDGFPFWATSNESLRIEAVEAMRQTVLEHRQYGKYLADLVASLIRKRVLRPIHDKSAFVRALNRLLALEQRQLKYSTLVCYLP